MLTMVWPSKRSSTIAPSNRLLFQVRCANSKRIATPVVSGSLVAMPSSHGPSSRSRSAIFPANTSFQQGRWWPLASAISRKTSVDGHNLMGTTITAVGTSAVVPPAPRPAISAGLDPKAGHFGNTLQFFLYSGQNAQCGCGATVFAFV